MPPRARTSGNSITETGCYSKYQPSVSCEGFIWVGCYAGLIRYDGNTFERVSSSTGIANVRSLYVDSRDRLWIGTNDSGLFVMADGEFKGWSKADGLRSASIRAISEDLNGTIYAGGAFGLAAIDAAMNLTEIQDERIADQAVMSLRRGSGNLIYGITERGDLFTLEGGVLNTYTRAEKCTIKGITCILPDPAHPGFLYFGTDGSNVYYGNPESGSGPMEVFEISPLCNPHSFELIGGKLWITAIQHVKEDVDRFAAGAPQFDDITMLCLKYYGSGESNEQAS